MTSVPLGVGYIEYDPFSIYMFQTSECISLFCRMIFRRIKKAKTTYVRLHLELDLARIW